MQTGALRERNALIGYCVRLPCATHVMANGRLESGLAVRARSIPHQHLEKGTSSGPASGRRGTMMDMQIREQHPDDAAAVRRVLTDAFADDGHVADLAEALLARPDRPGPALVADVDGAIAGHVQLSRSWVDAAPALVEVLVLSPVGVAPTHQRHGIGRALCAAAVEQARQLGAPAVFLEGDPGYYSRLGWERADGHGFTAPSVRIPDVAFQVILLPGHESWMTGALVYNDTFWHFDGVGLRS